MKTNILICIATLVSYSSITYTMDQKQLFLHKPTKIEYSKNNFGDIFPQWQNIPSEHLTERLSLFVSSFKNEVKETPFIIEIPHEKAAALDAIKKAGFTFFHANNDQSEWIFKNGSSIPEPYTAQLAAGIIIRKGGDMLVMEEKTRPQILGVPGGTTDFQELIRITAARELKEEMSLIVNPDDLKLLAIVNCVRINRFNANQACYYYTVDHSKVSGDLIPNPNEVIRALYAPLQNIAKEKSIEGLLIYPAFAAMARHLLNDKTQTHHETLLDYRQLPKEACHRDLGDTMTIEFFAQ